MRPGAKRNTMWLWVAAALFLSACSSAGYYAQSVKGQVAIWRDTRTIESALVDPTVSAEVKEKLRLVLEIRQFAADELGLPDNESYTEFVDVQRPYLVWSVFAAPELSMQPQEWCFLVVGCVTYRGYFEHADAQEFAQRLKDEGLDVYVGGIPAYSTLGWFDDPVPSTVLHYSDASLAALIFHELAHQVAFAKGDTVFNESFATAVERIGVERWLRRAGDEAKIARYRRYERHNEELVALILDYRGRLEAMYDLEIPDPVKRERKESLITELKRAYKDTVEEWEQYGYRDWFQQPINNAKLVSVSTYNDLVPAFEKLLSQADGDLPEFYQKVQDLAGEPKAERRAFLDDL